MVDIYLYLNITIRVKVMLLTECSNFMYQHVALQSFCMSILYRAMLSGWEGWRYAFPCQS